MQTWLESLSLGLAIPFFWMVAIVRTSAVYALGRGAAGGARRFEELHHLTGTTLYRRAEVLVQRWGVLAVPACFLTVGLQTAVILTTAVARMPLRRWVPAMLVGTLVWGVIYGTVGMAVVWTWLERPWIAAPALVLAILAVVGYRLARRRTAPRTGELLPPAAPEQQVAFGAPRVNSVE